MEGAKEDLMLLLEEKLSGLGIRRDHIAKARQKTGLNFEKPGSWSDGQLQSLISELRKFSKPMLIAANKIDVQPAEKNLKKLTDTGNIVVPCCAEAELALRRGAEKNRISYIPGNSNFTVSTNADLNTDQTNALTKLGRRSCCHLVLPAFRTP